MKTPDLNQDEYSLSRPTFPTPKGGVLTVVGWKGKSGSTKKYVVKCDLCSKDPELFGDGTFRTAKGHLNCGRVPCGCASNPRWTENQNKVRVQREATARGLSPWGGVNPTRVSTPSYCCLAPCMESGTLLTLVIF